MKKRLLIRAFVFVLSILLLLAGCQPAPEKPVVVGRDEENSVLIINALDGSVIPRSTWS